MYYLAFKLDMIGSRNLNNRREVQQTLLQTVDAVNEKFAPSIESKFVVTHGDEVQGLLHPEASEKLLTIVEYFVEKMRPVKLRFGVGFGALSTRLQPTAIGMDGEAWYHAKDAIDSTKKHTPFHFKGCGSTRDRAISALANLLLASRYDWTNEQRVIIDYVQQGSQQAWIAHKLGITEAAVSGRLSRANWQLYEEARQALGLLLLESVGDLTP